MNACYRPLDPVFDMHRNKDAPKPLDMPGPAATMPASMVLHGIEPGTRSARPPASLLADRDTALREARYRLRCGLLASLENEPLAEATHMRHCHYLLGDGVAERRRNRVQAISIAPLLLDDVVSGRAPATRVAIDTGTRLYPAIARDLCVPVWVARRLPVIRLQAWQAAGRNPQGAAKRIAGLIESCGPEAPPADLAALCALNQIWRVGGWLTTNSGKTTDLIRRQLMHMAGKEAARRGWESVQAIMGVSLSPTAGGRGGDITCAADGGSAWVEYLAWLLHAIQLVNQAKMDISDPELYLTYLGRSMAALVELLRGLTLSDLPRLARRWRAALAARDGALQPVASAAGPGDAAILFAPCVLPTSGCRIEQLLTAEDLHSEGTAMQHCAATYAARAASGRSLIVRLRHLQRGARATLEFRCEPFSQVSWVLVQISTYRNGRPDAATLHAADECHGYLNHLSQQIAPACLQPYIAAAAQVDLDPCSKSVLALLQDSPIEQRFVPRVAAGGVMRRLHEVFDAASAA